LKPSHPNEPQRGFSPSQTCCDALRAVIGEADPSVPVIAVRATRWCGRWRR
jgi:hypothetical protein